MKKIKVVQNCLKWQENWSKMIFLDFSTPPKKLIWGAYTKNLSKTTVFPRSEKHYPTLGGGVGWEVCGKKYKNNFNQFSRHFKQFWTTLIFLIFDQIFFALFCKMHISFSPLHFSYCKAMCCWWLGGQVGGFRLVINQLFGPCCCKLNF